jgi:hypothetical protein
MAELIPGEVTTVKSGESMIANPSSICASSRRKAS